jgi:hypothetical protein
MPALQRPAASRCDQALEVSSTFERGPLPRTVECGGRVVELRRQPLLEDGPSTLDRRRLARERPLHAGLLIDTRARHGV